MNPLDFPNPKIAAYVRVSRIKQSETSLDTQLDEIQRFADTNGLVISDVYKDKVTASGKLERPNFSKMIEKAFQGKYNLILVYKQDRFHRDNVEEQQLLRQLEAKQIYVISVTENIDTTTPSGRLLRWIMSGINNFYIENLRQEIKSKTTLVARRAYFLGGIPPFGFGLKEVRDKEASRNRKIYVINEEEADIVRLIFKHYVKYKSYDKICKFLNENEVKTRKGNAWSKQTLYDTLRNEKYCGTFTYRKGSKHNYHEKRTDTIRVENALPAIVSKEIYDNVQDILASKSRSVKKTKHKALLSGLIYCGDCGSKMHVNNNKNNHQYICSRYKNYRDVNFVGVGITKVERFVVGYIKNKFVVDNIDFKKLAHEIMYQSVEKNKFLQDRLMHIKEREIEINQKINNATEAILNNSPLREELEKQIPLLKEELEELETSKEKIVLNKESAISEEILKQRVYTIQQMINGDREMQSKVIRSLVEKVTVYKSGYIEITEV